MKGRGCSLASPLRSNAVISWRTVLQPSAPSPTVRSSSGGKAASAGCTGAKLSCPIASTSHAHSSSSQRAHRTMALTLLLLIGLVAAAKNGDSRRRLSVAHERYTPLCYAGDKLVRMMARPRPAGEAIRIVSGGQTGVDRAALAWAIRRGVPYEGWCPKGRRAEDGTISSRYRLRETPSAQYFQRTAWNVRDSDATVIFSGSPRLLGGSRRTLELCRILGKPALRIASDLLTVSESAVLLKSFLRRHHVGLLNVAGPRKSQEIRTGRFVQRVLDATFGFT